MSNAEVLEYSRTLHAPELAQRLQAELLNQAEMHKEVIAENANLRASIERGEVWIDGALYRTECIKPRGLKAQVLASR